MTTKTTSKAARLHAAIEANTAAYLADAIGYAEFDRQNRAIWNEVEACGLRSCVSLLITRAEKRAHA